MSLSLNIDELASILVLVIDNLRKQPSVNDQKFCEDITRTLTSLSIYELESIFDSILVLVIDILRKQPSFNDQKFCEGITRTLLEVRNDKNLNTNQIIFLLSLLGVTYKVNQRLLINNHWLLINNHLTKEKQDNTLKEGNEPNKYDIETDRDYSRYESYFDGGNDAFAGVDWGDTSTFNQAAWDNITDRD